MRRRTILLPALAFLLPLVVACSTWRPIRSTDLPADETVRITTYSGRQFPLYFPEAVGDSMIRGALQRTDSAFVLLHLDSIASVEKTGTPTGEVVAATGFTAFVGFIVSLVLVPIILFSGS